MEKPGVILRRAVGTKGTFGEKCRTDETVGVAACHNAQALGRAEACAGEKAKSAKTKKPDTVASRKAELVGRFVGVTAYNAPLLKAWG